MPMSAPTGKRITATGQAAQVGVIQGRQFGLHLGDEWAQENARAAASLFGNQALMPMAALMATIHPGALDYIKQAPVLVLAVMGGQKKLDTKKRHFVLTQWKAITHRGEKLRDVLTLWQLPLQLRAIKAGALAPRHWPVIQQLAKIDNSTLAQIIPSKGQAQWIRAINLWIGRCQQRLGRLAPIPYLAWCAAHWRDDSTIRSGPPGVAGDMADFAMAAGPRFNTDWTWQQARAAQERWHANLAKMKYGDEKVDYGAFPDEQEHAGYIFVALRSGIDLHAEGMAMHHCVASYFPEVVAGSSRIISIRKIGGGRLATAEFRANPASGGDHIDRALAEKFGANIEKRTSWRLNQLKAACNKDPGEPVWIAARSYRDWINGGAG